MGLRPPAPPPARRPRPRATPRRAEAVERAVLRALPRSTPAAAGHRRRRRAAAGAARSTRSTGPTTSSRRCSSRSSPTTRSPSPSSARSGPTVPPIVVLTSNRTRDVHDALKRRCLYHWVEHPGFEREVAIVRLRAPGVARAAGPPGRRRRRADARLGLYKPPGVAETDRLGARRLPFSVAARLDAATVDGDARRRRSSTARTRSECGPSRASRRWWPTRSSGSADARPDLGRPSRRCCDGRGSRSRLGSGHRLRQAARPRSASTARAGVLLGGTVDARAPARGHRGLRRRLRRFWRDVTAFP